MKRLFVLSQTDRQKNGKKESTFLRHSVSVPLLLPRVAPIFQINACIHSLTHLITEHSQKCTDAERKLIVRLVSLLKEYRNSSWGFAEKQLAKNCIRTVVSLLDIFVMDEMSPRIHMNIGTKAYGRAGYLFEEEGLCQLEFSDQPLDIFPTEITRTHYVKRKEMDAYFKELSKKALYIPIYSLNEFKKIIEVSNKKRLAAYYFNRTLTKDEIEEALHIYARHDSPAMLILPFHLNEEVSGFALSGRRMKKEDENSFLPQSEPSRQEILETLLEGGLSLMRGANKTELSAGREVKRGKGLGKANVLKELEAIWDEIISLAALRDVSAYTTAKQSKLYSLLAGENEKTFAHHAQKTLINSYMSVLMGDRHGAPHKQPVLILTRTGLSATTFGVYAAAHYFDKTKKNRPLAYIQKGLYYEADTIIRREFSIARNMTDAHVRVFCINVSSNPPYTTLKRTTDYKRQRDDFIWSILRIAKNNPRENYFLIVDKTTNLLYRTVPKGEKQPENLHLFEIASLTKYRHGDRNHFAGVVVYEGGEKIKPFIRKALLTAHATISLRDLCFFHTFNAKEVEAITARLWDKGKQFQKGFMSAMRRTGSQFRWRIESNRDSSQYIYLIPPMSTMIRAVQNRGFRFPFYRMKNMNGEISEVSYCYKKFFKKIVKSVVKPFDSTPGYERASSFGLNTTRVTFIPGEFSYRGALFFQKIPRVSFGLETPCSELETFGKKVADALIKQTIKNTL